MALLFVVVFTLTLSHTTKAHAADNNFADGITVDSTLDTPDIDLNDTVCDDGAGNCTLRAAIQVANSNPDASTILFDIQEAADFTSGGQSGYTIEPTSALPQISEQVTINGYSQPGAQANTAIAPQPLNGRLLVELKGSSAGGAHAAFRFIDNSNNSTVKGLVINDFGSGDAFVVLANGLTVQGNYIGTDPTGSTAHPNRVGLSANTQDPESGHDALIGGLNPADRNLISGNTDNSDNLGAATAGYPGTGWVIQGNYVGVAADGLTPVPNGIVGGSGAFSIDDCQDVVVGGNQPGAINVIGTNLGHGIAPHNITNVDIIGNIIGLGYDGETVIDNGASGITGAGLTFTDSTDVTVTSNKIAGWKGSGVYLGSDNTNFTFSNNEVYKNVYGGLAIAGANIHLNDNTVYNNGILPNIQIGSYSAVENVTNNISLKTNKVGIASDGSAGSENNASGVKIYGDPTNVTIGGTSAGDGNEIAYNKQGGIIVSSFSSPTIPLSLEIQKISILGNTIHSNQPDSSGPFASGGLGIDLYTDIDSDGNFSVDTATETGPTPNDSSDTDTGPNGYINFPVLNSVTQDGTNATINFNLDAADSPTDQYRVEFFANDTADPSGYGEGQTFLGSTTVSNGNDQTATITLPSGTNLTGKYISATTTAIDGTTDSGYGATSEFSAILTIPADTTEEEATDELADTGEGRWGLTLIATASICFASILLTKKRRLKF